MLSAPIAPARKIDRYHLKMQIVQVYYSALASVWTAGRLTIYKHWASGIEFIMSAQSNIAPRQEMIFDARRMR
jgi:spore cortex formation protein SpoVR/YcgB (stage V sporulation)